MGRPSLASTLPPSGCSPSTRGEQTPGATETGRSCTKVALRSFVLKPWNLPGKTSWESSPRDQQGNSPSGSERGQAKRPETQPPQRVKKREVRRPLLRKKRKKSMTK